MNSPILKLVSTVAIAMLSAGLMAAEPLSVPVSKLVEGQQTQLSGVLGYLRDCSFALYPDRLSSLKRDSSKAVALATDSKSNAINAAVPLEAYVNAYVLAKGSITKMAPAGDAPVLSKPLIYYAFSAPNGYAASNKCTSAPHQDVLTVEELLQAGAVESGIVRSVSGVLEREGEIYRLYSSNETAKDNVWSHAVDLRFKPSLDLCAGRELIVEGIPRTPRRRTGVRLELVDARLVASACGSRTQQP